MSAFTPFRREDSGLEGQNQQERPMRKRDLKSTYLRSQATHNQQSYSSLFPLNDVQRRVFLEQLKRMQQSFTSSMSKLAVSSVGGLVQPLQESVSTVNSSVPETISYRSDGHSITETNECPPS